MEFNSIIEIQNLLKSKKISILELNKIFIDRIKKHRNINAYIFFDEDLIIKRCKDLDNFNNENLRLKGIPLAIKDLFCTVEMPTTAASKILSNFAPTYESFVTKKLLNQGSVFLGKTNLDEFAMGSSTTTSYFGNTINPKSSSNIDLVQEARQEAQLPLFQLNYVLGLPEQIQGAL